MKLFFRCIPAALSIALPVFAVLAWSQAIPGSGSNSGGAQSPAQDALRFPRDSFTLETAMVRTFVGEKKVTYRSYKHIPYTANPVDKDYQSLNVSVPVRVDDRAVDASQAPILFVIGVGGYLSVSNADRGGSRMGGPLGGGSSRISRNSDLALAAGFVVASPGCRGRDNKAADGTYFGKAPSAKKYLNNLADEKRRQYLANNPWITWSDSGAAFSFADYAAHVGRMKGLPAFDDFDMKQPEPNLFGNRTIASRHFTNFSLRQASGDKNAKIDDDVRGLVNLMNPMHFILRNNAGCSEHWWLRQGTSDNHTSQTVMANLAASLENRNKDVNARLYWDAGHGADEDAEDFIAWIGALVTATGAH
jgi:hypothetical protein